MQGASLVSRIMVVVGLVGMASCNDGTGPGESLPQGSAYLLVSNPLTALTGSAGARVAGAASSINVAYVSLVPGSVPAGVVAEIVNRATGASITTVLVNGGFDPTPIAATVGDTLLATITRPGTSPVQVTNVVRANAVPVPVRTSPKKGARDVPLNSTVAIVFSEPMDGSTIDTGSVHLWRGPVRVPGTVRLGDSLRFRVEFLPGSPLLPKTGYRLEVISGVRDQFGVALPVAVEVSFTTGEGSLPAGDLFSQLYDFWGTSGSNVFAVGVDTTDSFALVAHFDGRTWQPTTLQALALFTVWGSSSSDVFAGGEDNQFHAFMAHFDGTAWLPMALPPALGTCSPGCFVRGLWGTSSSNVYATVVGQGVPHLLHYDGVSWSPVITGVATIDSIAGTFNGLIALWGSSASDVFAVGWRGWVLHFDGTSWSGQQVPEGGGYPLGSLWGSGPNDVFAATRSNTVYHYDGSTWSTTPVLTANANTAFWAMTGTGPTNVLVGDANSGNLYRWDGTTWAWGDSIPDPSGVIGLWARTPTDIWVGGGSGGIFHLTQ
jgi:Big-like domain-containing protein